MTKDIGQESMDSPITRRKQPWTKLVIFALIAIVAVLVGSRMFSGLDRSSLNVNKRAIQTARATKGTYDDFVAIRASVLPIRTQFVEAVESGRVETVLVEEGSTVSVNQLLLELSNTSLQLDTIGREADIAEQLNNLSTSKLQFEQNQIEHQRRLLEIDWNVDRLERLNERQSELAKESLVSEADVTDVERELEYWTELRVVTNKAQETDTRLQQVQIQQLDNMVRRLTRNLEAARQSLDNLKVRSPIDGILSSFVVNEGQVLSKGDRIGQIDDPRGFKLTSQVEEFYLPRIAIQQPAIAIIDQREIPVHVSNIYPEVIVGQFRIDLRFQGNEPENIRKGQSVSVRLILGESTESLMIPNGQFFLDTGGTWVFVLSGDGSYAERRNVTFGKRSSTSIEVVDGLAEGDVVITSSYKEFLDYDQLNFLN